MSRVSRGHPELDMEPIPNPWPDQNLYTFSDHFSFLQAGIPILYFYSGKHSDYHGPGDSPDKIDAEKLSRITRLMFYVGLEIANAEARPRWKPERHRELVGGS